MKEFFTKRNFALVFVLLVLSSGIFVILFKKTEPVPVVLPVVNDFKPDHLIVGKTVEGRNIDAYTYGQGETHLLFVGGIHGGYEWNSVILAYRFMDYLEANPEFIPANLKITIIPSANPDGIFKVVGKEGRFAVSDVPIGKQTDGTGRFNASGVDLNRNFDCNWKPKSTWRGNIVSAGAKVFSEPEALAIRDFVSAHPLAGAVFWHSQSNAVYASACEEGILPKTLDIMKAYSLASGYQAIKTFDQYAITGDAEGWLASLKIPAITVELKTHETVEWEQNLAGVKALFEYYGREVKI